MCTKKFGVNKDLTYIYIYYKKILIMYKYINRHVNAKGPSQDKERQLVFYPSYYIVVWIKETEGLHSIKRKVFLKIYVEAYT